MIPPDATAQEPSAVVAAIAKWAGVPPGDVSGLGLALGAVLIGVMTRHALAAGRGEPRPKLWVELMLLPVEVIIALVAVRGAGATGIVALVIAVAVGHGGARLVSAFLTSSEGRLMPPKTTQPPIYVPPAGADPDQDLLDKLKDQA